MTASEAQKAAVRRYQQRTTYPVKLKLNIRTDADIIQWLEQQPSKQGAVKRLIKRDILKGGGH